MLKTVVNKIGISKLHLTAEKRAEQILMSVDGLYHNPFQIDISLNISCERAVDPQDLGAGVLLAGVEDKIKAALYEAGILEPNPEELGKEIGAKMASYFGNNLS